MKKYILYITLITFGVLIGIVANRNREYLINAQFIRDHFHFRKVIKDEQAVVKSDKVMVMLTFGQSNAANYGLGTYTCKNEVYNYYKGDLYRAEEPLLGPDGGNCSVWTRVADMVIDSGLYKKVIIVPIGIGQTSIDCWVEGGCKNILMKTLDDLKRDHIQLTHILWQQGETDNVDKTTKETYKTKLNMLVDLVRNKGFNAPFFVSVTSYFPYNNNNPMGIDKQIIDAQLDVINERADVKHGPYTDTLNLAYYRNEGVHFTEKGLDKLAAMWYEKIKENN